MFSFHFVLTALLGGLSISAGDDPLPYGSVNFPTSCSSDVQNDFNTAVSLLYSFWYSEALKEFSSITDREPTCCMAYWGAAMTFNHPIWDFMDDNRLALAESYSAQGYDCTRENPEITARELGYLKSLADYVNTSDPTIVEPAQRLHKYADSIYENVYQPYGASDENAG